jgi:type II secretory pathway pseudopilin PulG
MLVLSIVGILSAVGVSQLAPRSASAVRTLMDEVEGALGNAHRAAAATGRDTAIVTWGTWAEGTLRLAHGDATLSDADIQMLAAGTAPSGSALSAAQRSSVATAFRCLPGDRAQAGARIVALGSGQWGNAMQAFNGRQNVKITDVQPFADASSAGGATGLMNGLVVDGNRLFPEAADPHRVVVNGSSKRFMSSFIIPIVGTTSSGGAVPGAPMGLIVVLDNGASIFKFYNPGARDGDGAWRRI